MTQITATHNSTINAAIFTTEQVEETKLHAFLSRIYSQTKVEFLRQYGSWWHHGDHNRWVLQVDGQVVGYCGIIPARILTAGKLVDTLWWVDLIIAPEFRGLGLQRLFDQKVKQVADLKLGFPNQLAAKIHRKHGWGVRDDLQVQLLPLYPRSIKSLRATDGIRGTALHTAAVFLEPPASLARWAVMRKKTGSARRLEHPEAETLAAIFDRYQDQTVSTTYRDSEYIQKRFLDAPHQASFSYYLAGPSSSPTHYLICRMVDYQGVRATRILDLFGNHHDIETIKDLVILAVKDAISSGSKQVTVMTSLPHLRSLFRSLSFIISSTSRFTWISSSRELNTVLSGPAHWVLADSDNDAYY